MAEIYRPMMGKLVEFRDFTRPFYKTHEAQAYFVDRCELILSFNFGNGLKPTRLRLVG